MSNNSEISAATRVLFVDDEIELAELVSKRLKKRGYSVSLAHNATDAMQVLVSEQFDVVVSDINMPGATGFDFLELCQMTYGLPVILVSGNIDQKSLDDQSQIKGAFASLPKPFQLDELAEVIDKAASFSKSTQTDDSVNEPLSENKRKILFVEDEEILREMLSQVITSKLGQWADLLVAENGRNAADLIENEPFDVIVTDLQMPEMGGQEFLKQYKEIFGDQKTHVIVISAYSDIEVPEFASLHRYSKPVRASEIVGKIKDLLNI